MATINLFRNTSNFEIVPPNQVIIEEGEQGDAMYIILEGFVDIILDGEVFETVGEGGIFGEMALIDNEPRSATVIAKTYCKVVPVTRKQFNFMIQQTPYFVTTVMSIMADRLRRMNAITYAH